MDVQFEDLKMTMWEQTMLPEKKPNPETGKWEVTGEKEERTTYTFRDEFGEIQKFLGKNDYRELEGRQCNVTIAVKYNDYDRKTRVSLVSVSPAD